MVLQCRSVMYVLYDLLEFVLYAILVIVVCAKFQFIAYVSLIKGFGLINRFKSLSFCLSVSLSIYICIYMSLSMSVCLSLSLSLYVSLSLCLSIFLPFSELLKLFLSVNHHHCRSVNYLFKWFRFPWNTHRSRKLYWGLVKIYF